MSSEQIEAEGRDLAEVGDVGDVGTPDVNWNAIKAARYYPRQVKKFAEAAQAMATIDQETAAACSYTLTRGKRRIAGPSVRLAEICASAWGNLDFGARIGREADTFVIAQGFAYDLQTNTRCTFEIRRRITTKEGHRFNDDLITQTVNAAQAIALRNAIFRVIPRALVAPILAAARRVAAGDEKTLGDRRTAMVAHFAKLGVSLERVAAAVGKPSTEEITGEDLVTLRGLVNSVNDGLMTLDDAFPDPNAKPAAATAPPAIEAAPGEPLF